MPFQLSERQQQTVASAITIVAAFVILCALAALFWLLGSFFAAFSNVFLPLAVAGVLALLLRPYYVLLNDRLGLPVPLAITAVFMSLLLPIAAFGWFFGAVIVDQVTDLIESMPGYWERVSGWAQERWPQLKEFAERHDLQARLTQAAEGQAARIVDGVQSVVGSAWSVGRGVLRALAAVLGWVVLPVYFAFFLMVDPRKVGSLEDLLPFLKTETRATVTYLVREFVGILIAFFRGQLIIALLQGLLFAIGFSIVGLSYGFVLGLMLGLLNIIPYLGSIVGLGLALPTAYFQQGGGVWTVVWVIVVFTAVQMIEGYVLTPRIMGDRTGLHPMVIIVAIFFWGSALNGILGMLLAIPLTAFLVVFWRLLRERYMHELV